MKGQIGSKNYCQSNCRKFWILLDGIGQNGLEASQFLKTCLERQNL